jgi:hypothetical protein
MEVDGVHCEPLSAAKFLITRKNTWNSSTETIVPNRVSPVFIGVPAIYSSILPNPNREFLRG